MKKILLSALSLTFYIMLSAQSENDTTKEISLKSVVISGTKFAESQRNIVQKIDVVSKREMKQMNAQSTADVLINTGQVFVQKSQQGGGSPVLRGFEASRVLLMVDGIRLNNAIYRSGHLQNVVTIDNNALDKVEVLYGPSSVVHGSDALGGSVNMRTREAHFGNRKKTDLLSANALIRTSTANAEKTASLGLNFANHKWSSVTQLTFSNFGDVVQGKNGVDSIMRFWKKNFIVQRINGKDSMVKNPNPFKQTESGFSQIDVLQKIAYKHSGKVRSTLNLQASNSSDIPRYDRLTETTNGIARSAEWYYGPQFRTLAAYSLEANKLKGFINDAMLTLSHQWVKESRINRNFNSSGRNTREEDIKVIGYSIALRHSERNHEITLGTDGQLNNLTSVAIQTNINTGIEKKIDTRYPDGKNNMNYVGLFVQDIWKVNDEVVLNGGLRGDMNRLKSNLVDTSVLFRLPFLSIEINNQALTGNIGIAFMPQRELRFTANVSRGFRTPNFDDLTKVFGSRPGSGLIIPNSTLKPEYTTNYEIGMNIINDKFDANLYGFYTDFTNAIITEATTLAGNDSVLYDGVLTPVFTSVNKGSAFIYGAGINLAYKPVRGLTLSASTNYTYGRFNNDTILVPLDHVAPVHGRFGIKYNYNNWYAELYSMYNGRKKLVDYNPAGEDNLQYATPNGMPGWFTINTRFGITIQKYVQLQLGLENILDKNYRYFASGFSAPGRNAVVAIRLNY